MYGIIDTHAHLEEVEDLDQALKRAEKAGVIAIITMDNHRQRNGSKQDDRKRKNHI